MRKVLIGGAWPYGNYLLHIGHLAALLPGDVLARYHRKRGDEVMYVSGTDAHGTPITERAKKEGKTPKEIADYYHEEFVKSFESLDFSYDLYTTTDTEYHKEKVKEYFLKIYENGYLYEKEIEQDYCEKHGFLSDREIMGTCPHCGGIAKGDQCDDCLMSVEPSELTNKKCNECGNPTTIKNNKHLYFKLSAFQNEIQSLLDEHKDHWRFNAVNETKKYLDMGLIDRAATRQIDWGIDVPIVGYEDKKIYVWFEAVMGYFTACEKVCEDNDLNKDEFMKANSNLKSYYVMGKDNIPFHTVIWPALLQAMDKNYDLPEIIESCEYVNMNDEKMSKSKGNLITANELVEKYGKNTTRYFMIINNPERKDVNFTEADIITTHNKFLVGVLGNFINRNLSFIKKKFDGLITEGKIDEKIKKTTINLYKETETLIENGDLREALEMIMEYVSLGNKYYDENEPWIKVKEDIESFNNITYTCVYMIANIANLLDPFLPEKSDQIRKMLNLDNCSWEEVIISDNIQLDELPLLFERYE